MKENSISYKTAKQETERLIYEIEKTTITHRAYTAECLKRVLKENDELKEAINVVNKEKADWIRAYQEEKDKQFDLLRKNEKLKTKIERTKDLDTHKLVEGWVTGQLIPTQTVKDKIEELDDYIQENSDEQGYWGNINPDIILWQKDILQELLEEED